MAIDGKWNLVIKTPMGDQTGVLTLKQDGDSLTGEMTSPAGAAPIENGRVDGEKLMWEAKVTSPMPCLLYTSPSPRDLSTSRMPSSA